LTGWLWDDPIGFSISLNVKRRHLTAGQLAAVAHAALPLYEAEAAKNVGGRPPKPGADLPHVDPEPKQKARRAPRARDKAAKATGVDGLKVIARG